MSGTEQKRYATGYTQGVFDMFHIGHLNLINNARKYCDKLIVGVNSDRLVEEYKCKKTVIPEEERYEIVSNIKAVDECVLVDTLDKSVLLKDLLFDVVFIGDDWKGSERWMKTEKDLMKFKVEVIYLPYTRDISSTILRLEKDNRIDG